MAITSRAQDLPFHGLKVGQAWVSKEFEIIRQDDDIHSHQTRWSVAHVPSGERVFVTVNMGDDPKLKLQFIMDQIRQKVAPSIYGAEAIKKTIATTLTGGTMLENDFDKRLTRVEDLLMKVAQHLINIEKFGEESLSRIKNCEDFLNAAYGAAQQAAHTHLYPSPPGAVTVNLPTWIAAAPSSTPLEQLYNQQLIANQGLANQSLLHPVGISPSSGGTTAPSDSSPGLDLGGSQFTFKP